MESQLPPPGGFVKPSASQLAWVNLNSESQNGNTLRSCLNLQPLCHTGFVSTIPGNFT